jgi:hypothetical protein
MIAFQCDCDCHESASMVHCMDCCEGSCPACGVNVYSVKKHLSESTACQYSLRLKLKELKRNEQDKKLREWGLL